MKWILWPFEAIANLVTSIIKMTGRLVAAILGLIFMIVGVIISMTIVGAILGIPIVIFGFVLVVRGFF